MVMMFLAEAFFSGCISKLVNDGTDYSKSTIRDVICDKKNQDFSTKIYRVIEKALNSATYNKYKSKDILYDATERLFVNFKENGNSLEAVKACLSGIIPNVDRITCEIFIEKFIDNICRDDYLFKRVTFVLDEIGIKYSQNEFSQLMEIIKKNHEEIIGEMSVLNENYDEIKNTEEIKFKNNKKEDYIEIWNSRLFLHTDENKKIVTLADAFIMPDYKINKSIKEIVFSGDDLLNDIIQKVVDYSMSLSMLIIGEPGIGKSSIVSYLANQFHENENVIILDFHDWNTKELKNGILGAICNTLTCKRVDLKNKLLILDGFDEIKMTEGRKSLLDGFFDDLCNLENFKCIITSRPAYIYLERFDIIAEILPFDAHKIEKFYLKMTDTCLETKKIDVTTLKVLGIPFILYMAIMSNIDIEENSTKPILYKHIFAEKLGIFNTFNKGSYLFSSNENIKVYLNFLRDLAFKMFEKDELYINIKEVQVPLLECDNNLVSILEFPVKYLFLKTDNRIEFVHKSIYEYFVSQYMYFIILKEASMLPEELAGVLGKLLKNNRLSSEILEFLRYEVVSSELNDKFNVLEKTFQLMLENGMIYYTKDFYKNAIVCEMNVFSNMLEVIHLWDNNYYNLKFLNSIYLKYNKYKKLNLKGTNLEKINLSGVYLTEASLQNARLTIADLDYANLERTNLTNADLTGADLKGTNLRGATLYNTVLTRAYLNEADLEGAKLINCQLSGADLKGANLKDVDLRGCNLEDVNLEEAVLVDTIFDELQVHYLKNIYNLEESKVYIYNSKKIIMYYLYNYGIL